jgi:transcription-repair coupling factor (superfamily II helicase)
MNISNETAFIWRVFEDLKKDRKSSIIVVEDDEDVEKIANICESINKVFKINLEILRFDLLKDNQVKTVEKIYSSDLTKLIIASNSSFNIGFAAKENFKVFNIKVGFEYKRSDIIEKLIEIGFNKVDFVENQGEFATRGSVIDIFNFGDDYPRRIYFDLNKVLSIRKFEIDTQNTFDFEMEFSLKNFNLKNKKLSDLCFVEYFLNDKWLIERDNDFFLNIEFPNIDIFINEIKKFLEKKFDIYIFCLNEREISKIISIFDENQINYPIRFIDGYIPRGFYSNSKKIFVVSSIEIFQRKYDYTPFKNKPKKIFKLNDLDIGDFVVHEDYGIGRYCGIKKITHRNEWGDFYENECILIEYSGGDKLYVSLDEFKKISKYVGSENSRVKLSSLSGITWKKIKERVKKEIENVARDIIKIEAKRKIVKIKPMFRGEIEGDFELDFEYEHTPDQKTAIDDVLRDLESGYVTTRIVVGDVGFGKTEVAMRACMRAVENGFQCLIMCPTTILAEQHYRNFYNRFSKFAINVKCLTRLVSDKEKNQIIKDISLGVVDIVIGTHMLLSEKIKFKKLGLCVIDEEHKFGVKQKEEIKKRYNNVHVIYLSATPIPRTLYQSISDLIKISVIETPPQGRLSVNTEVLPYDENRIIDAVNFELKRGGQIYYVYNRVEFMERKKLDLQKLLPGVRIASVNGQMKGDEIEDIMIDFMNKKYDLLLASTIIESGIDIPSVNTLIVEDAHKMGLSQLYQLRGRVGREKKKAYCYLFYPKNLCENEEMNSGSLKRLFALEEFSELGSGFRLAMRDLEIRGAGDLLGTRQHGFINAVGLDMYLNLLEKEIKRIKGFEVEEREKDVLIDLKISAFIPPEYINDDMERLNFYKRLYSASTDEIDGIVSKMKDMAGPIPPELENLVEIIKIKNKLKNKGVEKIIEKNFVIEFYFSKDFKISKTDLQRWQKYFNENIRFFKTSAGDGFEIKIDSLDNKIYIIKKVFEI